MTHKFFNLENLRRLASHINLQGEKIVFSFLVNIIIVFIFFSLNKINYQKCLTKGKNLYHLVSSVVYSQVKELDATKYKTKFIFIL